MVPDTSLTVSERSAYTRRLLRHLGLTGWGGSLALVPVPVTEILHRELHNLDVNGSSREKYKVGVVFVGQGATEKETILCAARTTTAFESFAGGLGWEVDLLAHRGYSGLNKAHGRRTGTVPYHATATMEVIFHVAHRINPVEGVKASVLQIRTKHVLNDAVVVVWLENDRTDFQPSFLQNRVTDMWIVVCPLPAGVYRVRLVCPRHKALMHHGPLFDGSVVDAESLPMLVRATAVNGGRKIRAEEPGHEDAYQMRAGYLRAITGRQEAQGFAEYTSSIIVGCEATKIAARRRAREMRLSGKVPRLRRSMSTECLDKTVSRLRLAESRRLSVSNNTLNAATVAPIGDVEV
jgi:hypothetical protein